MIIMQGTIRRLLAERYARGKQRFSYGNIAEGLGIRYEPGDFRNAGERISVNEILKQLEKEGYVRLITKGKKEGAVVYGGVFLPEMEMLCRETGIVTKTVYAGELRSVLLKSAPTEGPVADLIRDTLVGINKGLGYDVTLFRTDFTDLPDALLGADAVIKNEKETYIRDLSKKIYNDSKRFGNIRGQIEKYVRRCSDDEVIEKYGEMKNSGISNSILPLYGVLPFPYPVLMEADAELVTEKGTIRTFGLSSPIMSNRVGEYVRIRLLCDTFVTIENRATYEDFREKGIGKIFTGGFPGFAEKKLLSVINRDNPTKRFMHWGDMDVGGFNIFRDIQKIVPSIEPLHMDVQTLLRYESEGYVTALTENDRLSLEKMRFREPFGDTVDAMLKKNIKFEQEAFFA